MGEADAASPPVWPSGKKRGLDDRDRENSLYLTEHTDGTAYAMHCRTRRKMEYRRLVRLAHTVSRLPFRIATSFARTLPSYLIIGVQKGGTTSLLAYLSSHPHVLPGLVKEPHFFDFRFDYGLPLYRACFPLKSEFDNLSTGPRAATHCGEASPYYIYDPRVPHRVKRILPDVKLLLLLRNPIERAFSHYRHNKALGYEGRSLENAIDEELTLGPRRCLEVRLRNTTGSQSHRHFSYLTRGLYLEQIMDWRRVFPRDRMLVLKSEDLFCDTAAEFEKATDFLGLDRWQPDGGFPAHNVGVEEPLDARMRDRVAEFYRSPNKRLCEYLGVDMGW